MIRGDGEEDARFVVLLKLLGLDLFFDRGLDDGFDGEEGVDFFDRFFACELGIRFGEVLLVDGALAAGMFPGFLGGVGEDGGEEFDHGIEDFAHDPDAGFAALAVGGVAVEAVFCDVDVVGAEVGGGELVDGGEDFAEVVFLVGFSYFSNDDLETLHDPLVDEGKVGRFADFLIPHVSKENLEGVSELAVGLANLGEEGFAEGDLALPIDGGDPEAEDV